MGEPYVEVWPAMSSLMDQIDSLCVEKGCAFLDLRPLFDAHPEYIQEDQLHPTHEGSEVIASEIHNILMGQCGCDVWQNGDCGGGSCTADTREQTRICAPPGCLLESKCVTDTRCECRCGVWQEGECGGGSCGADEREQTRFCLPSGCDLESQCVSDTSCNP